MSPKLIRRTALLSLLLPFLYFGTASAMFLLRIHAEHGAQAMVRLPAYPSPRAGQRIVVFAPHCDDETLGCGGLLQQAADAGAALRVVFITNGDGFRVAVERQFRKLRVEPDDYIRFADLRQQEALRALGVLGVRRDDVLFLGYPDRGLMRLWTGNWAPDHPFTSPYTGRDCCPYPRAYREDAVYCGQGLLDDVKTVLRTARPTDVYVTHPSDDHPDHCAASAFVALALQQLKQEGEDWSRTCRLDYYLVHRGDWPVPQGLSREDYLVPPAEMADLDTRWSGLALSDEQVERKMRAILAYRSQTAVMKRFLLSFARRDEVFGALSPARVTRVPAGAAPAAADSSAWRPDEVVLRDPVNDTLLRDFQAGGDVRSVSACRDDANLYLRVDTSRPISSRIEVKLRLRYFGDEGRAEAGGMREATVRSSGAARPADLRATVSGASVEVAVPLRSIGYAPTAALDVETDFAGLQVDRTGYRFLSF